MNETKEQLPIDLPSEHDREEIKILEVKHLEKFESSIPKHITNKILSREQLPQELPPLGSSIIEDFIADKLNSGIGSSQKIAELFKKENISDNIKNFISEVKATSERVKWDEVFTMEDASTRKSFKGNEINGND